jgi:hypothetical protein
VERGGKKKRRDKGKGNYDTEEALGVEGNGWTRAQEQEEDTLVEQQGADGRAAGPGLFLCGKIRGEAKGLPRGDGRRTTEWNERMAMIWTYWKQQ